LPQKDPEIDAVLGAAGLAHLAGRFAEEDIDMSVLRTLGEEDLRGLGLTLGQRRKLLGRLKDLASATGRGPQAAAEPESRRLTVLFSDLVGFTELATEIDPDELRAILQKYHAAARHAAGLFGGFIASLQGDGIVMLFGFPLTQAGSADRALGAAHALLSQLQAISHRLPGGRQAGIAARIGIASGRAIVGYPEGAGEPQMVGPVINRAARLQGIAGPGCVVVDEPTRLLASPAASFAPLPDAELKGFAQKVQVWQARASARPAAVPRPPRTARSAHEAERRQLDLALQTARAGQPALVLLSGEAGIGKSTLAGEFAADAEENGLSVLRLSCMALAAHMPLQPVVDMLEAMLGTASDAAPAVRREALRQVFASAPAEEEAAVAALLGLRSGLSEVMAPAADRQLLLGALARFLTGGEACLILIEDIHWVDATTRDLLQRCADAAAERAIMILATSRDGQDAVWAGNPSRLHVHLPPLGPEAAGRLLSHHLAGRELPEPVAEAILSRSDGNPLMIEALARSIDGWKDASPGRDIEVPSSIYESIAARVETLRAGREAAAALSVFGEPTEEATLALALGIEIGELGDALADLTGAGIAERFGSGNHQAVRFHHSLYREVCYERLVKSARERLHRAAFAALTRMDSGITTRRPGHVAWHAFEAGEHSTAAPLSLAAGEQSMQRSAMIEASHFLRQAQASLDRLARNRQTDQLRLSVLIAQSSICRARLGIASDEAGQLGRQVLELAQSLGDIRSELIALNGLYTHALVRADYAAAGSWAERLHIRAILSQDQTFSMIGTRAMGVVALHTGAVEQAVSALQEALGGYDEALHLPLAHLHGYDHAEICAAFLSIALWIKGDPLGAETASAFSVSHSRRIDHKHSLAQALVFRALLKLIAHDGNAAAASAAEAREIGRKHGLAAMHGVSGFFSEAGQLLSRPEPPRSEDLQSLSEHLWEFRSVNPYNYHPVTGMLMAKLHLAGQATDAADEALCLAEAGQQSSNEIFVRPELMRIRSQLLAAQGDSAAAEESLMAAFRAAEEMGAVMLALRIACDMAEANPTPEALDRLKAVRGQLASEDGGWDLARCQALLASAAA